MIRSTALLAAAMTLALAGCAKVGTLERPAPLYGAKAKAQYRAERQAAAKAKADQSKTQNAEDLPDDVGGPPPASTPRNDPVPGAKPSPFGTPAPGVLPDPFNNPQ